MTVIDLIPSRETCSESGWYAWDFLLRDPLNDEDIRAFRNFGGSFLYLSMLKKPFFKIENHYYILKGCRGDDYFRMAVHDDHKEEVERIRSFLLEDHTNETHS